MQCAECLDLLNPYHDGELLPEELAEVRDHLALCPECTRAYDELVATSHLLQDGLVRYAAPDVLNARIRSALAHEDATPLRPAFASPRWLRLAAAGLLIAVTSSLATWGTVRVRGASRTARDEILATHVRSLMPGHLMDVASNNQHNVKPWFNGRVDLSPPVPALDSTGFVLDGGRLDYVGGRTVAAIVYLRRQHVVNVFSWPEAGDDSDPSVVTTQGYHLVNWRTGGVAFWAASDLNQTELSEFVALFRHGGAEAKR
ncbi:MAG: putative transrane anti-sigma factor [Gemmatimonadetes bacterium]|nr:putative transrane anti-sigma factor [Gemmatimonadota bacterium]